MRESRSYWHPEIGLEIVLDILTWGNYMQTVDVEIVPGCTRHAFSRQGQVLLTYLVCIWNAFQIQPVPFLRDFSSKYTSAPVLKRNTKIPYYYA